MVAVEMVFLVRRDIFVLYVMKLDTERYIARIELAVLITALAAATGIVMIVHIDTFVHDAINLIMECTNARQIFQIRFVVFVQKQTTPNQLVLIVLLLERK